MTHPLEAIPVTELPPPGHYGRVGEPGVVAHLRDDVAIATLAARKGTALAPQIRQAFGVDLVDGPRAVTAGGTTFIGTAPGRWLATSETDSDLADTLKGSLNGVAAVTEQSDGYVVIDISGPQAREMWAKNVAIDLDPSVFKPGDAAATVVSYVGVTFWQLDASPSYRVLVARSYAGALLRILVSASLEYGLRLEGRG
ncbi:MAG TPA: sarcosine oxidase subunit gamma family protein [Reyranella sp.]|nr:sarcosine oxidase subunit gamma family protein [Reyranella sp.]